MNKQTRWIFIFVAILVMSALACDTFFGNDESDAEVNKTEVDQASEVDEQEEPAEAGEEESGSDDQNSFFTVPTEADSYRTAFSMEITVGQGEDATPAISVAGEGVVSTDPPASSLALTVLGVEGSETFSDMTVIQIEDATYFTLPTGDCFSGLFGQDDIPFDAITQGSEFVEGVNDANLVEKNVEINGINTDHYSFNPSDVADSSLFNDSIQNFEGHIYVSDDGHLVRVAFSGEGGVDLSGLMTDQGGRVSYQLDYFDINEPVDISVPEACSEAGATELPLASDAFEITSVQGITTYFSNLAFDELIELYRSEMAAEGWTLDQEFTSGTTASLSFSLNDAIVLVTVEEDSATGQVTVLLIEQ